MEKRNSQLEHGHPMAQARGFFCPCNSGVARFQSQHQYHFWRMSSMHKQVSSTAVSQICVIHEALNGCINLKLRKTYSQFYAPKLCLSPALVKVNTAYSKYMGESSKFPKS